MNLGIEFLIDECDPYRINTPIIEIKLSKTAFFSDLLFVFINVLFGKLYLKFMYYPALS